MDLNRIILKGYGDMTEAVRQELKDMRAISVLEATKELEAAAKVGRERYHVGEDNGGGEVKMMIPSASYHYWGQRLGYQCWKDKQFVAEFLRDNPAARVRSRSKKLKVGFRGTAGGPVPIKSVNNKRACVNYGRI